MRCAYLAVDGRLHVFGESLNRYRGGEVNGALDGEIGDDGELIFAVGGINTDGAVGTDIRLRVHVGGCVVVNYSQIEPDPDADGVAAVSQGAGDGDGGFLVGGVNGHRAGGRSAVLAAHHCTVGVGLGGVGDVKVVHRTGQCQAAGSTRAAAAARLAGPARLAASVCTAGG